MSHPLVSVVIPCYNQAQFLGEAIESVLAQTYADCELLVVNDGSTDTTLDTAARYPTVCCISQANQGVSAARNAGFQASRGDYLVFLDADDRLLPDALAIGARALDDYPACGFAYGNAVVIAKDGRRTIPRLRHISERQDPYLALLYSNAVHTPGVVMYRRDLFEDVGGFDLDLRLSGAEDLELNLRLTRLSPVICHGRIVLEYRVHGENATANPGQMLRSSMLVLRSQRWHVHNQRRHQEALSHHVGVVQHFWGGHLTARIKDHLYHKQWRDALRCMLILLRYYPQWPAQYVKGKLWVNIQRLPRSARA
jgi:glycosyltransferase involved in cell wall biosynthesis